MLIPTDEATGFGEPGMRQNVEIMCHRVEGGRWSADKKEFPGVKLASFYEELHLLCDADALQVPTGTFMCECQDDGSWRIVHRTWEEWCIHYKSPHLIDSPPPELEREAQNVDRKAPPEGASDGVQGGDPAQQG